MNNRQGKGFAKGVGIELSVNRKAILSGPISTDPGTENKQYLGVGSQTLSFMAKPILVGEKLILGDLNATAVLTMRYQ